MTKSVQFALLGCGRVSQRYLDVFVNELTGAELVGCCDHDAVKSRHAAQSVGPHTRPFNDYRKMINAVEPDVVCVLTESGNHYKHADHLLDLGCNVVVEKPVTLIPEQAYALADKAESLGLMLSVVKQNRFNPAIRKLKEVYDSGRFGKIITATIRLRWCRYQDYYEDGWHGTWAMDGGVINQQAIHHVDALNWICGPISEVCAATSKRLMELEAEDTLTAIVKMENGALGTIEATTAARPEDMEASLSVVGEKGIAVIGGIALNEIQTWNFVEALPEDADIPSQHSQLVPTGYGLGHGPYLQEIAARLSRGDKTPVLDARDGVKALEVVHALYASSETRGWAHLSDRPRSRFLGEIR